MRILTDCPERLPGLVPERSGWSCPGISSLCGAEQVLWHALSSGGTLWTGTAAESAPPGFWPRAFILAEAPESQFDVLQELARGDLKLTGPVACLALHGRNFHGQRGRSWSSAPGNLHLSVLFSPADFSVRRSLGLTMLPAVAVAEAVWRLSGGRLKPGIKWVNDILVEGRKIAGVITATQVLREKITRVTLGIGLNVAHTPEVSPTVFVPSVGSLHAWGLDVALVDVFLAVLEQLGKFYAVLEHVGADEIFGAYKELSLVIGREVCIWEESEGVRDQNTPSSGPLVRGVVRELAPDLSLRLEGVAEPVSRGRLAFAESVDASHVRG